MNLVTKQEMKAIIMASLLIGAVFSLTACFEEDKTVGERLDNAAESVSDGVEDAAEELDPNRTTGEKIGDAVEDAGQDIQDAAE